MGEIYEYDWYILAVIVLATPLLIALFTSPSEEALVSASAPAEPKPQVAIGTFRIIPSGGKIAVERFKYACYDDYGEDKPRWCTEYLINSMSRTKYAEFDTEREAEVYIEGVLFRESEQKREEMNRVARVEAFAKAHPVREVPPYKYLTV